MKSKNSLNSFLSYSRKLRLNAILASSALAALAVMPATSSAYTFTRGDMGADTDNHLWSNTNNWASGDWSSGAGKQTFDDNGWAFSHPTNVGTGTGTMYFGPNSRYIGDTVPTLDIENYILLDIDASINKLYTSEFYNGTKDSTDMVYGISDAKTWDASGNITDRHEAILTFRAGYTTTAQNAFDVITTSFASRAVTFDVNIEIYSSYLSPGANSYTTGLYMLHGAGAYDVTYTDGHTLSVLTNPTSGADSHLVFKLGRDTVAPAGTLYLNSKVVMKGETSLTFTAQDADSTYAYQFQKVVIGGSQTNQIRDIRINPRMNVTFAKTGGAMVISRDTFSTTYVRMYSDTVINFAGNNQVELSRLYVIHNNNSHQENGWTINLNGYSQGIDSYGKGLIEALNFYTSAEITEGDRADLKIDFGVNSAVQEFYVGKFLLEGTYFSADKQNIVLKNYILGEDHFLMGTDISDNATAMSMFKFEGYDMDKYEVVCEYDDVYQAYDITLALIPEPSAVAAILGVVAIAFAAYRRRK